MFFKIYQPRLEPLNNLLRKINFGAYFE